MESSTSNNTKVNVDIGATAGYKGVVQRALKDFDDLWGKIGAGKLAMGLAAGGFAGMAVGIGIAVKQAGDFQSALVRLTTSAGESVKNLGMVSSGIKEIANSTGTDLKQLTDAMYVIESGGQHGADGLKVLQAAAQGAKTENAELKVVADAVTSVLQDYHLKASDSADVTSKLVAAVGTGKTTFQELAGSLHSVLPIASSANISLSDVTGALASMTVHGMSADQASQNLADTIKHMVAPTQVQTKELGQLGISSADLADKLGKKGITGTLQELSETILKHMGPNGRVMLDSFNQSKDAANDANIMISRMPAHIQNIAKEFQKGQISLGDFRKELKGLPTDQANLLQQFASLQNRASGFNDLLKTGAPAAQTYQDALRRVTGDATGLNVALMLTGENTEYVNKAVKTISGATTEAGGNVKGWSEIQGTFNQRLSEFKAHISTSVVSVGQFFLPAATAAMGAVLHLGDGTRELGTWFSKLWKTISESTPVIIITQFFQQVLWPVLKAIGNTIMQNLAPAFGQLWTAVTRLWNALQPALTDALKIVGAILIGSLLAAILTVVGILYVLAKAISFVISIISDIISWISNLIQWFGNLVGIVINTVKTIITIFRNLWPAVKDVIGLIIGLFASLGKEILHALGDFGSLLYDVGRDLVKGLLNGIKSMAEAPERAIKDIGSSAVKSLKSMLGIHSPSTVFAEIGQNMGQGLVKGLDGIKAQANLAVTGLVTGSSLVNNNGTMPAAASNNTTNNTYSSVGGATHSNTFYVTLDSGQAVQEFFKKINQDSINVSRGLSPVQGAY